MFGIYSHPPQLDSLKLASIQAVAPELQESFSELLSVKRLIDSDTRGYLTMFSAMADRETPGEKLERLAVEVAPRNSEAVAFAVKEAPNCIVERAEILIPELKSQLSAFSFDRLRLKLIERELSSSPKSIDSAQLAQTLFDIAVRISPVNAAVVAANFFISAMIERDCSVAE